MKSLTEIHDEAMQQAAKADLARMIGDDERALHFLQDEVGVPTWVNHNTFPHGLVPHDVTIGLQRSNDESLNDQSALLIRLCQAHTVVQSISHLLVRVQSHFSRFTTHLYNKLTPCHLLVV